MYEGAADVAGGKVGRDRHGRTLEGGNTREARSIDGLEALFISVNSLETRFLVPQME